MKIDDENNRDGLTVSNYFNNYFIDSVNEIIQHASGLPYPCSSPQPSTYDYEFLCFEHIDYSKTDKIIKSLSNSKAKDFWGLDSSLIKKHREILTPAITYIVNKSIDESIFPSVFKTAVITPIYKSGSKNEISNYRPISILPVVSKILEKAILEQLTDHLDCNNLLHSMQFGFRRNHSTDAACCYLIENIRANLDRGGTVGAVFLDLRKAFDTVNHRVLLSKLSKYNLSMETLHWMQSYLSNRMQCVRVNNALSSLKPGTTGVPQGSILGPLLFSIYINDLPAVCKGIDIIMYADDVVIYVHGRDKEQVAIKLSLVMDKISNWLKSSCLTLNIEKTVGMYFVKSNKVKDMSNIYVNGQKINIVTEIKYLGVHLDQTLSFKKHIKRMCNCIKYNISTFRHIRNSLTIEASFMYFNAMISSHITYCLSCWSQANETTLKPLRSVYNQALKVLDRKAPHYHHCNILSKYKILSFDSLIRYTNLRTVFKIINNIAPPSMKKIIKLYSEQTSRTSRSTAHRNCAVPKRFSAFAQTAFSFKTIKQWNQLPERLKLSVDLNNFSRNLKKYILDNQLCQHQYT